MPNPCGNGGRTGRPATICCYVGCVSNGKTGRGVKEFVQVLRLHQQYPTPQIEQAVEQALAYGCAHFDGVKHCLEHLGQEADRTPLLDLTDRPHLALVGTQPIDLQCYDQLLERYAQL